MTPEVEAHWRYMLERMTNYGSDQRYGKLYAPQVPDEVHWLREEARYHCHLANAHNRRAATFVPTVGDDL